MKNAQLNKQWWTTQKKSQLEVSTQTNLLCKSTLDGQIWQRYEIKVKLSCFLSCVFSPAFAKTVLNIKVSIYTVYTEQQGQNKRWKKKQKTSRSWQLLYAKSLLWEIMWSYCVAVAAIIQYLQPSFPCQIYTRTKKPCILNNKYKIPHFPLLFCNSFSSKGEETEDVSAAALKVSVHTVSNTIIKSFHFLQTESNDQGKNIAPLLPVLWIVMCFIIKHLTALREHPLRFCYKMWV